MYQTKILTLVLLIGLIGLMLPLDHATAGDTQNTASFAITLERPAQSSQTLAQSESKAARKAPATASGDANQKPQDPATEKSSEPPSPEGHRPH